MSDLTLGELFALTEDEPSDEKRVEDREPPTRLGVVGSRDWPEPEFVAREVLKLFQQFPTLDTIVSGGQPKGVDGIAKRLALHFGYDYIEHAPAHQLSRDHPRYAPYHVRNYHERNGLIVRDSDMLVAFRYLGSTGTTSTITQARHALPDAWVFVHDWPLPGTTGEP